jgi:hypothetical protein
MNVDGRQSKTFFLISVFNQILMFSLVKKWGTEASIEVGNHHFES